MTNVPITKEMHNLGFSLETILNSPNIIFPTVEGVVYRVGDGNDPSHSFTKIDSTDLGGGIHFVNLKTSLDEEAKIIIDESNGTIELYEKQDTEFVKVMNLLYEPDNNARNMSRQSSELSGNINMKIEYDGNTVKVFRDGDLIGSDRLTLPKGITFDTTNDGKVIRISDSKGKSFKGQSMFGENKAKSIYIFPNSCALEDNNLQWSYTIGNCSSGFKYLQKFVDEQVRNGPWKEEFNDSSYPIHVPSKGFLLANGPNRVGAYELTSGNSSILTDPVSLELKLGQGFNTYGATSRITEGSLKDGYIIVKDEYPTTEGRKQPDQYWEIIFNFDNTDSNRSYTAQEIKPNI